MKVFFVKYNDPIYVKLEKLDIMIRLTTAANIAQVLAELKELVFLWQNLIYSLQSTAFPLIDMPLKWMLTLWESQ